MKKSDYSREVFEKYYNAKGHILEITLKDNIVLEGIFVGFVHGDESFDESYIIRWRFLPKDEVEKHIHLISIDGSEDYGRMLEQKDIKCVKFKE